MPRAWSPGDGEFHGSADEHSLVPGEFVGGDGEPQAGEPGDEGFEGALEFGAGQWCAEAVVGALAEGDVRVVRAVEDEVGGVLEDAFVAVGGGQGVDDGFMRRGG